MVLRGFTYIIASVLLFILVGMKSDENTPLLETHHKKVQKSISKLWDKAKAEIKIIESDDVNFALVVNDLNGEFYNLVNSSDTGYLYMGKANACHEGGCDRFDKNISDRFERFEYMVVFNNQKEIIHIQVLKYEAEYGYEICSKRWLNQFIKTDKSEFDYGSDIQAISGATVSAQSITNEVNKVSLVLETI